MNLIHADNTILVKKWQNTLKKTSSKVILMRTAVDIKYTIPEEACNNEGNKD
jgi:hypothetical protein